jgi:hypothetical protein
MRLLVVVPALNEANSVPALLADLSVAAAGLGVTLEAVVIDDASTDATADVASRAGARVVRLCRNLGIGGAVQTGLRLALREQFDAAVQMDADGQHPPSELHKLLAALGDTPRPDVVVGSRYLQPKGFQSTWLRRTGIIWLRLLIRVLTGKATSDPTSGYRLYGPRALALFSRSYPYDYPEPEALVLACAAGLVVSEVPVVMKPRQAGSSSISRLHAPYYMLKVTVAVVLAHLRRHEQVQ